MRGLVKTKKWPKVSRETYTALLNSLFQLKPWLWSEFEQNFEKRVFCLYFGRFPIVKCPFLQCRVAKAEMTHAMAYGVFLLPVGLIRKPR